MHGVDHMQILHAPVHDLLVHQHLRDDADDAAPRGQRGIGTGAHEPDVGAAIDQAEAALGQPAPELFGGGAVHGPGAFCGCTKDSDGFAGMVSFLFLMAHRQSIHTRHHRITTPHPMRAEWMSLERAAMIPLHRSVRGLALIAALFASTPCSVTQGGAQGMAAAPSAQAAAVSMAANTPGQFDFYLLDMSWGPVFCSSIKDVSAQCRPQTGFVVHGLWPQNRDGTWPQFCSTAPAPADLSPHLALTPDLTLLKHEWAKHGTCSGLDADQFFAAEHTAFAKFTPPLALINLNNSRTFTRLFAVNMLYQANPGFPAGSLLLSCREGHVTAVEACFSRSLAPIRCEEVQPCQADLVIFDPQAPAPPGPLAPAAEGMSSATTVRP